MRKYRILVLTDSPTGAHGAVLKNTFGRRPYTRVRGTINELHLEYDDSLIIIKRYNGGSLDPMRGHRWDEVWIDEYTWENANDNERDSIRSHIFYKTRVYNEDVLQKEFPHYSQRDALNFFDKSDDGFK